MKKKTKKVIDAVLYFIAFIMCVIIAFVEYSETKDLMLQSMYICLSLFFLIWSVSAFIKSRKL